MGGGDNELRTGDQSRLSHEQGQGRYPELHFQLVIYLQDTQASSRELGGKPDWPIQKYTPVPIYMSTNYSRSFIH